MMTTDLEITSLRAAAFVEMVTRQIDLAADGDRTEKAAFITEIVARWLFDYPPEKHAWLLEKLVEGVHLVNSTHPPKEQADG